MAHGALRPIPSMARSAPHLSRMARMGALRPIPATRPAWGEERLLGASSVGAIPGPPPRSHDWLAALAGWGCLAFGGAWAMRDVPLTPAHFL